MPFNSINFFIFLFLVTIIFFIIPRKIQWGWILVSSCYFYINYSAFYLIVFLFVIVLNYYSAILIEKVSEKRKGIIVFSIILLDILILFILKYYFYLESSYFQKSGISIFFNIIFPLGLSYFIFSLIAYIIEIKRGNVKAERHIGIFASAYMFFPKLAQGPIERPQNILPQFHIKQSFDYVRTISGLKLIIWGLFKKLVVADRLSIYVNTVYDNYKYHNGSTLILATVFYSFQIYADFSGYTDIAIGTAQILGFNLNNNFKRPYFARSVKEFWNRWHISFSTWLRDYLFLPLAYMLTRKLRKEKYLLIPSSGIIYMISIMLTFFICGLWHGEGIKYLIWGLIFGTSLTGLNWANKLMKKIRKYFHVSKNAKLLSAIKIFTTFLLVTFAWIFFRADNTKTAFEIIEKIITVQGSFFIGSLSNIVLSILSIVMLIMVECRQENITKSNVPYENRIWIKEQLAYVGLILIILLIGVFDGEQFIYFKF